MNFSTAEEQDAQKNEINSKRIRKLTGDRKNKHGNNKLAQTDGLKPIHTGTKRKQHIVIDDQIIDPRRIRNLRDIEESYDD